MASKTEKKEIPLHQQYLTPIQGSILEKLSEFGPLTLRDFVRKLNTPRTTIFDNLKKLENRKLIEKYSRNNGRGRPLIFWKIKK